MWYYNIRGENMAFYDGTKLLSLKDINGETPQFYLCTTNRTGGKTTYFSRLLINRFLKTGKKFVILYRFSYELGNCGEQFFNDIHDLFFPEHQLTSLAKCKGKYYELLLDNTVCGYALAINNAEFYKRRSHLFNTVETIFFDEFQSETGKYCANEIRKFKSIIVSICRGQGKQYRYVPVYMCGNMITILNPYFTSMGIADRIRDNTNFLRGNGYVLEQGFIDSAADAQKASALFSAFSGDEQFNNYSTQKTYLNDNMALIERPKGNGNYIATIVYKDKNYSITEYPELGVVYCGTHVDLTYPFKVCLSSEDMDVNYVILKRCSTFVNTMRYYFDHGCFRFKNLECKEVILKALTY